ncbi:hypothetical protein [Ammoniphilus sp. CFH 90114]|uniref:hypothetical protein n=1 Tax=Ammoniphilus sp. CFH 90114 TaxID=2493665 RepID=UPI00100F1019|nr:hypothetical protein [Ammoniphilus sp. CFH 90114]RXT13866.1 hypothetical protein EIZ39_06920 [Ammoniphilus sp. CFH 90114]
MELRRRHAANHSDDKQELEQELVIVEEVQDLGKLVAENPMEEDGEEMPPRSAIHGRKRKGSASSKRIGLMSFIMISLLGGGAVLWFAGIGSVDHTTRATAPSAPVEESTGASKKEEVFTGVEVNPGLTTEPAPSAAQEEAVEVSPTPEQRESSPASSENVQQPSPPAPTYDRMVKHKVEVGETLYRISIKYYASGKHADFLSRHNKLSRPSDLVSGTYIEIPFPPLK